eukprot:CAMPEP_0206606420 /NCGR_PEP_ID=MMETSP0325_2-20121206/51309_1 /ASSEMBLY_ACC=CAM_ASM_000347 /TAXON_ID=2866 /ORGANISM="Crypthecodinium cohnii, Strain Seligo" /LENGTH=37 /DNA_ID= /DNA_START= /DNA_END= /DNA_ORIENTATION=
MSDALAWLSHATMITPCIVIPADWADFAQATTSRYLS